MKRLQGVLGRVAALLLLSTLIGNRASAVPTFTNPQVLATNVGGLVTGTDNTQFIFRCNITASSNTVALIGSSIKVIIDPFDPANPEFGGALAVPMVNKGGTLWVAYIAGSPTGSNIAGMPGGSGFGGYGILGRHKWSIVAREAPATDGTLMNGTGAAPKPAGDVQVQPSAQIEILPVTATFQPDKRVTPNQLGNGLSVDPLDSTAPNDGGSSHFYTWRVRIRTLAGLPPQAFFPRSRYEWRDTRFDQFPAGNLGPQFVTQVQNSGVVLVLIDPTGQRHYCPMEVDPDSPSAGTAQAGGPAPDPTTPQTRNPVGTATYNTGVYFRYRMLPSQYVFNWGPLPGEGPYTAFGGPTQPDLIPAIPIGYNLGGAGVAVGQEVVGRPYANEYVAFAGPDRTTRSAQAAPPFPFYTDTAGRAGQWSYYYIATTDLRPPPPGGEGSVPSDGDITTYPFDLQGAAENLYVYASDSDNGFPSGSPINPYSHPFVGPLLSDGGWTDDLPENGYASGGGFNAHRSRVTTKTRVRFIVRVTKADETALPAQAVRVYIDDVPFTMSGLDATEQYTQGKRFYYDTTFANANQVGQHRIFFEADGGSQVGIQPNNFKAIWPRRDWGGAAPQGTGDARYVDPQSLLAPYAFSDGANVNFGTLTVGKNYLNEPLVNSRPTLTAPAVTPPSGAEGQAFTYEIVYTDTDNDAPLDAIVNIDGTDHRMTMDPTTPQPVNFKNGVKYRFVLTSLTKTIDGIHHYYFKFRDNWNNFAAYAISNLRREVGEWTSYPQGDDNGNPSFIITGPTITTNKPAALNEPGYFFSDPSQTPATLYDFFVRYSDPENQPPANIKMYLSSDGGATWDGGTALVPAENSTNYAAGVLFHIPTRIQLPFINLVPYVYRFTANDGTQGTDSTEIRVGNGQGNATDGSAHELKPVGSSTTIFGDPAGTTIVPSTKLWDNTQTPLVWVQVGNNAPVLKVFGVDYNVDFVNGTVTFNVAPAGRVLAEYFYTNTVGPIIHKNNAPTLTEPSPNTPATNNGTLNLLQGTPTTSFVYTVTYTDKDNQAASYVNVVIDSNRTVKLIIAPGQGTPLDFTRGIKYTTDPAAPINLGVGPHTYHFEASDGADTARLKLATDNPSEYNGPNVTDPTNLVIDTANPATNINPYPKGKSNDTYTFTVLYKNPQGNAPSGPIEVRLTPVAPVAPNQVPVKLTLSPIDQIGPAFWANPGVRYQGQITATGTPGTNNLLPGAYTVQFGFTSNPNSGTQPLNLVVNGRPILSNPAVSPATQSQAGDITFAVKYADVNGDAPARPAGGASTMKLFIDGAEYTAVAPVITPTPINYITGAIYTWTIPAKNFSVKPDHTYHFEAKDDLEDSVPPAIPTPDGTFGVTQAALPTLLAPSPNTPATNDGTVTPLKGANGAVYKFAVIYKHGDGVAPTTIQLVIDEGAATAQTVDLQQLPNQVIDYKQGVLYGYSTTPGSLAAGTHKYYFKATDRLTSTRLPTTANQMYNGPIVNAIPSLSNATVVVVGTSPPSTVTNNVLSPTITANVTSPLLFTVTYSDPDFVVGTSPEPTVTLTIAPNTVKTLTPPKPAGQNDYSQPVVFSTPAAGFTLGAGQWTFHFDATDQLDPARLPAGAVDITGLTIANVASLDKVSPVTASDPLGGILAPLTGPLSTTFTYSILYKNADNTAPAYVNVILDEKTKKIVVPMTKASSSTNFSAGVVYQGTHRFQSGGVHTFHFEAADTVSPTYVAMYPSGSATSPINGPTINQATFKDPTFNPVKPLIGLPVTVSSQLQTTPPRGVAISVQLVRPDGTGVNDTANSAPADGTFTYTFTPMQTGDWRIRFTWAGETGVYDAVTQEFPFTVGGYSVPLGSGQLDFIASPLIPVTPDPSITFGATDGSGNPLSITVVNLIKWSPSLEKYLLLNQDGNFPGITGGQGYWVKPSQAVTLNPRGRVTDQTQPYTIPLTKGWNMIGSVYLTDTNWSAVKVRVNGTLIGIADAGQYIRPVAWSYNAATHGYQMVTLPDGVLSQGRGYWVHAEQDVDFVLPAPGTRAANPGRDAVDRSGSLQIMARSGQFVDRDNFAPLTSAGNSRLALQEKPPVYGSHVGVHFVTGKVDLTGDTRIAAANASNVVVFDVETDKKNADISVDFPNLSAIGRRTEAALVDLTTNTRSALGSTAGVTYNTGANTAPRRFAVILTAATVNNRLTISNMAASSSGRSPAVGFSFHVSGNATIKAQIVGGPGGSTIRTLDSGRAVAQGANNLLWDGKDSKGVTVPSGSYMLKITATDDKGHSATGILPVTVVR